MRPFLALLGKELQGFFKLPLVYFVAAVFLALSGYYFYTNLNAFITFGFGESIVEHLWQRRVADALGEHEMLDDELDIHHPAAVVLEIEERSPIRMTVVHLRAHRADLRGELGAIAREPQDLVAKRFEARADRRVAGGEAGARQRLMLPGPRLLALVALE